MQGSRRHSWSDETLVRGSPASGPFLILQICCCFQPQLLSILAEELP